jgi:putative ABC transport system permease protein
MTLESLRRDLAYAVRSLFRSRAFTIAAILTLAIGIGATTAIYSVVDTVLLQPLPFPESDRLVRLLAYAPPFAPGRPIRQSGITHQEFLDWRQRSNTLEHAAAVIDMSQRMVKTPDGAAGLWGAMVTASTFELLPVRPWLGRTILPGDEGSPDVVVLSYETWQTHYHGDPAIVGKALEFRAGALLAPIPARFLTVVGVLPADFELPTGRLDFMTPIALDPSKRSPGVTTIARLAPGVSMAAATADANLMGNAIRPPWPEDAPPLPGPRFELQSLKARAVESFRPALRILMAAVVVVLLIVCANVANLLLARGTARQREVAVRLAIGATRGQIVRQILAECAVLALAGGFFGALLGAAGVTMVKDLATVDAPGIFKLMFGANIIPRAHEVGVDWRLFVIAFGIAALTSVLFGLLPALHLSRANHLQAMGSRGGGSSRGNSRIRAALTFAQLVLATMLLSGAGLLIHSFITLSAFDKGYNAAHVLAFNLLFPDSYSTARKAETIEALLGRFRANPSVQAAGFARHGILIGEELYIGNFVPPGQTLTETEREGVRTRSVSAGYLTAMAVPVLEGRELSPADSASAPGVIVINRSAAKKFFGDANAVGQQMTWHLGKLQAPMTVVGVVEDVRQEAATDPLVPEVFVEYRQYMHLEPGRDKNESAIGFLSFALRTAGAPEALVPAVRDVIRTMDPNIGIDAIVPMEQLEASARARERFYAVVLGVFAVVAGRLAAIGVYGVLAYAVVQRTQEIGVRMALGARRGQVLGLIMRKGMTLAALGVVVGLAGAAAGARSLESLLFGVRPLDPWTFAAVAIGFALVAALASYLPARRATHVDPVVALRVE